VTASPVRQAESDAAPAAPDIVGRSASGVAQTAAAGDVADQPDVPVRPRAREAVRPPVAVPAVGVAVRSAPSPRQRAEATPRQAESGPVQSGPVQSGPAESGPAESGPGGADVS
jgi:hypothetical protein